DDQLTVEELRGILSLRRAEAHDRLAAEAERLSRVEARLAQLEEHEMSDYDVVVKRTDAEWVVAITETVNGLLDIGDAHGRLWPRLDAIVQEIGVDRVPPSIARERGTGPIEFTAALPVPDDVRYDSNGASTCEIPGLGRAATTVMYGDDFNGGFRA